MSAQLLSLGSINLDLQMRLQQWPPAAGDTPIAQEFAMLGGGKAANVACLARRLGATALLIGCVGTDDIARLALQTPEQAGVDLHQVHRVPDTPSGIAFVHVTPGGEKIIVQAPNANLAWDAAAVDAMCATIAAAPPQSVLIADLEVPAEVVEAALEVACAGGLTVIVDPTPTFRVTARLFEGINYLTPNAAEAGRLTGMTVHTAADAIEAARILLERGVTDAAMIKLHDGGCVVVGHDGEFHLAAPGVCAVDSTGAGDAFAGALGVAILEERPLLEAARFAVAAAGLSVMHYGAQPSYPLRSELDHFLAEHAREIVATRFGRPGD